MTCRGSDDSEGSNDGGVGQLLQSNVKERSSIVKVFYTSRHGPDVAVIIICIRKHADELTYTETLAWLDKEPRALQSRQVQQLQQRIRCVSNGGGGC